MTAEVIQHALANTALLLPGAALQGCAEAIEASLKLAEVSQFAAVKNFLQSAEVRVEAAILNISTDMLVSKPSDLQHANKIAHLESRDK